MPRQRFKTEEIIQKLREAQVTGHSFCDAVCI